MSLSIKNTFLFAKNTVYSTAYNFCKFTSLNFPKKRCLYKPKLQLCLIVTPLKKKICNLTDCDLNCEDFFKKKKIR